MAVAPAKLDAERSAQVQVRPGEGTAEGTRVGRTGGGLRPGPGRCGVGGRTAAALDAWVAFELRGEARRFGWRWESFTADLS